MSDYDGMRAMTSEEQAVVWGKSIQNAPLRDPTPEELQSMRNTVIPVFGPEERHRAPPLRTRLARWFFGS